MVVLLLERRETNKILIFALALSLRTLFCQKKGKEVELEQSDGVTELRR
jgi:hypothetical protein